MTNTPIIIDDDLEENDILVAELMARKAMENFTGKSAGLTPFEEKMVEREFDKLLTQF